MREEQWPFRELIELPANEEGRDFFIGDAHDHRRLLQSELIRINFDTKKDRLFLTGDFTCCGPGKEKLWNICKSSWAWSVMGERELWLLEWILCGHESYQHAYKQGGDWAQDIHSKHKPINPDCQGYPRHGSPLHQIAATIAKHCPSRLVVNTKSGKKIGVVHSSSPANFDNVDPGNLASYRVMRETCYETYQYQLLARGKTRKRIDPDFDTRQGLTGVDAVVHGHINVAGIERFGKQLYIDTLQTTGLPTILTSDEVLEIASH